MSWTTKRKPSRLRRARESRGLSLEKAAVAAGISSGWLRQLERDPTLLSATIAARLLPVLGILSARDEEPLR
jgi:transcriptional regulator with XRE-family HTH domain